MRAWTGGRRDRTSRWSKQLCESTATCICGGQSPNYAKTQPVVTGTQQRLRHEEWANPAVDQLLAKNVETGRFGANAIQRPFWRISGVGFAREQRTTGSDKRVSLKQAQVPCGQRCGYEKLSTHNRTPRSHYEGTQRRITKCVPFKKSSSSAISKQVDRAWPSGQLLRS